MTIQEIAQSTCWQLTNTHENEKVSFEVAPDGKSVDIAIQVYSDDPDTEMEGATLSDLRLLEGDTYLVKVNGVYVQALGKAVAALIMSYDA